jgi:mannitol/fructose-specific phosphotransferase system IIA component (Ntr-type)
VAGPFLDLRPFLAPDRVAFYPASPGKTRLLADLAFLLCSHAGIGAHHAFTQAILDREDVASTGIGNGVAVPHAQLVSIPAFAIAIGVCSAGVEYAAKDGLPVHLLVMIASPASDQSAYLRLLASVASRLHDPARIAAMRAASDAAAVIDAFLR